MCRLSMRHSAVRMQYFEWHTLQILPPRDRATIPQLDSIKINAHANNEVILYFIPSTVECVLKVQTPLRKGNGVALEMGGRSSLSYDVVS